MSKIAIVYWSGTGNTETMAGAVLEGAKTASEAELFSVDAFSADKISDFDGMIFGCPAMGDEVLEEDAFEPFFAEAEKQLSGVPVALFGSYGWGGGVWMKNWETRTKEAGAKLFGDGIICENAPDDESLAACKSMGENFAKSL